MALAVRERDQKIEKININSKGKLSVIMFGLSFVKIRMFAISNYNSLSISGGVYFSDTKYKSFEMDMWNQNVIKLIITKNKMDQKLLWH